MAETYFAVFDKQAHPSDAQANAKITGKGEILEGLKTAKFIKVESEAGTVAQAQEIVREKYPHLATQVPIIVTAAAWKES